MYSFGECVSDSFVDNPIHSGSLTFDITSDEKRTRRNRSSVQFLEQNRFSLRLCLRITHRFTKFLLVLLLLPLYKRANDFHGRRCVCECVTISSLIRPRRLSLLSLLMQMHTSSSSRTIGSVPRPNNDSDPNMSYVDRFERLLSSRCSHSRVSHFC